MFVRVKKIGPHEYLYLVENVREGGPPCPARHQGARTAGRGRNSDLLDGLIASAARHSRRSIVLSSFYRGELAELRRRSIGPDLVFGRLWVETGCRDVLHRHRGDRRSALQPPPVAVRRALGCLLRHHLSVFRGPGRRHARPAGLFEGLPPTPASARAEYCAG